MVWQLWSSSRGWAAWIGPRLPVPSHTVFLATGPCRRPQRATTSAVKRSQGRGRGQSSNGSSQGRRSRSNGSGDSGKSRRSADAVAVLGFGQAVRQGQWQQQEQADSGTDAERTSSSREGSRQTPSAGSSLSSDVEEGEDDWEEALAELSDLEVAELLGQDRAPPDTLEGADEAVERRLAWALGQFSFQLDAFQVKAVRHLLAGRSVVVCAPTGAGKTAIAEAAAIHYLDQGQRIIYTTPLKALSNQKLQELRGRFGHDNVGLQTGDASINIDSPVVVMTTEILRNVLYRVDDNGSTAADRMQDVALVVLDEVHYLGDPGRGSVWEEVIINCPPHIRLLAMSATVRNPEDLGGWISQVHSECDTVTTTFRPVPLTWHHGSAAAAAGGGGGGMRLLPLLDARKRGINPALLPPAKRFGEGDTASEDDWGRWDGPPAAQSRGNRGPPWRRGGSGSSSGGGGGSAGGMRLRTLEELVGSLPGGEEGEEEGDWHKQPRFKRVPPLESAVSKLAARKMLPAIWFIFSRRDCDLSAQQLDTQGVTLTSPDEQAAIREEVEALRADQPEAVKEPALGPLLKGAAAHHAGCLPAWKSLIERLFQKGLVKVVFATETLAAGINMPARTTIISTLSRRRDGGIVLLQHNELLQMAGRAGRRGYDTEGHCVILQSKWEDAEVAWGIIKKGPEALRSQFSAGYGMVLNLLFTRGMAEARAFLDRSFSRYLVVVCEECRFQAGWGSGGGQMVADLSGAGQRRRQKEIADLEARAQAILDDVAQKSGAGVEQGADMWAKYQKALGRLREEKRAAKVLRAQLAEERGFIAETVLAKLKLPWVVGLDLSASNIDDSSYRLAAVAVRRLPPTSGGWGEPASFLCLGADNTLHKVESRHISGILEEAWTGPAEDAEGAALPVLRLADDMRRSAWKELSGGVECAPGSALTALVAARLPPAERLTPVAPREEGRQALQEQRRRVKVEIDGIKADRQFMKAAKKFSKQTTEAHVLLDRAAALREVIEQQLGGGWKAFEDLTAILQEAGAFTVRGGEEGVEFHSLGQVAREVSGANELWLALVLTHDALQTLGPPQLAGVLSSVVAPEAISRPTVWTAYPATQAVVGAVEALDGEREALLGLQLRAGLDIPVAVDLRMAGVVEAWASGCNWSEVMMDCNIDEGDMARLLTRTLDLLKQVARCGYLLPAMRQSARTAARAMDRAPISDLVA
ncbi:hypothetical protein N2152v2_005619 [Parachlorella kessleri]